MTKHMLVASVNMWSAAPAPILAMLLALQGGYYPAAMGIAGIALAALNCARAIRDRPRKPHAPLIASAAFAICLLAWCAALPFFDGIASYETLSAISRPALAIATAAYWLQLSQDEKHSAIQLIAYEGVLFSIVALLMFVGVFPYPGAVVDGRLQFTFQYANTAGTYFAVISCLIWSQARTRAAKALTALPFVCTLLTQSMGTFAAAAIVGCAWALKKFKPTRKKRGNVLQTKATIVRIAIAGLGAAALIALALCIGASDRLDSALQTGAERLIQAIDGTRALASEPLIGIGPQQWRVLHPFLQSAQYTANVIHNSYLGFALSYGLIGIAFAALCMLTIWKGTTRTEEDQIPGTHGAAALLLLHAVVDFDLAFGSIIMLLVLALLSNRQPVTTEPDAASPIDAAARASGAAGMALGIALLVSGASAFALDVRQNQVLSDIHALDQQAIAQQVAADPFARRDQTLRTELYRCCTTPEQCEVAIELQRSAPITVSTPGLMAFARCLYIVDRAKDAELMVLSTLQAQPYNVAAYTQAADLFERYDADEQTRQRYETLRARSMNHLAAWQSCLLGNQQELPRIDE